MNNEEKSGLKKRLQTRVTMTKNVPCMQSIKTTNTKKGKAFDRPNAVFNDDQQIAEWAKGVIRGIDPAVSDGDSNFQLACFLAASSVVGPDTRRISTMLGIPMNKASQWAQNLISNGVWHEGGVCDNDWFSEESGQIGFILDTLVAEGLAKRFFNEKGIATYKTVPGRGWWDKN